MHRMLISLWSSWYYLRLARLAFFAVKTGTMWWIQPTEKRANTYIALQTPVNKSILAEGPSGFYVAKKGKKVDSEVKVSCCSQRFLSFSYTKAPQADVHWDTIFVSEFIQYQLDDFFFFFNSFHILLSHILSFLSRLWVLGAF